jgi:quinol monooxygenase YgiN
MLKSVVLPAAAVALAAATVLLPLRGQEAVAETAPLFVNIVDLDISPASMTRFLAALRDDGAGTIKEAGAQEFDATVGQKDRGHVFVFEVYNDSAAWDAHQKSLTYAKFIGITMAMIKTYNIRAFASAAINRNPASQPQTDPLFINVTELDIAPNQVDKFKEVAIADATASMQDPGCREFNIATSQTNPQHVLFFEVYDNAAALDAHQATDHYKAYQAATKGLVNKSATMPLSSVAMLTKGQ